MKDCVTKLFVFFLLLALPCAEAQNAPSDRVAVAFDSSEAEAVLAILDKRATAKPVEDTDWQKLFSSEPYLRLKKREASMHREFTDEDFRKFVLSDELATHAEELRRTLEEWKQADLGAAGRRVLTYLPPQARIRPKVYPVIKPRKNSFVFESDTDPAIFLYIDPSVTREKFENTVAHEMHHIGFASIESEKDTQSPNLATTAKSTTGANPTSPERQQDAVATAGGTPALLEWMGAFAEGYAMLAAAGGPDVHPHANSKPEDRARWDHDMANFNHDVGTLNQFLIDIVQGKFKSKEDIHAKGYSFFGVQGPWYTVGYQMAVTIEKQFGRERLIACMTDIRQLLPTYNQAAEEQAKKGGKTLALWSPELLQAIRETQ